MKLADYQRAVASLSFALEPCAATMEALPGFALYREMIRERLAAMARVAYARSWAQLGREACEASFARYLAAAPPASPRLREVVGAFAQFACGDQALLCAAPPHAHDLLRFEACVWQVASARAPALDVPSLREVDLEGALVLEPTLRLLALAHPLGSEGAPVGPPEPHVLLVYRRPAGDVRWYRVEPALAEVLERARVGRPRLAVLVRDALASRGSLDGAGLDALVTSLTLAIERGVVLGVCDADD